MYIKDPYSIYACMSVTNQTPDPEAGERES